MKVALLVLAKSPEPGRVKTRLTPPFSAEQAAQLATAALQDTLEAATAVPSARVVLVLDGPVGPWIEPFAVEVIGQRGNGLDERIASAFEDVSEAALLVGMDTPQVTGEILCAAIETFAPGDAVLGPAADGGYWAIGLREPKREHVLGVPMSLPDTGARQLERLRSHGLAVSLLPELRDVDCATDAIDVARTAPRSRFARALAPMVRDLVPAGASPEEQHPTTMPGGA